MINKEIKRLFFLYIGVFFVFPFIVGLFIPETFTDIYNRFDSFTGFIYVSFFLILMLIFDRMLPRGPVFRPFKRVGKLFDNKWFNFILIGIFFGLAVRFSLKYGITFRQNGEETLGETGIESILLFAVKTYTIAFVLMMILRAMNDVPVQKWQRFIVMAIAVSDMFIIVSSLDMLYILGCLIVIFKKEKVLFNAFKIKRSTYKRIIRIVLLAGLAFSVVFVGYADKVGTEKASQLFSDVQNIEVIVEHTTARIGVWYASVMAMGNRDILDDNIAFATIDGITNNLSSRIKILTGADPGASRKRQGSWSAARMNYLQLYKTSDNSRTGAAPGLIASSFYMPYFPFNFIVMAIYTVFILRKLSRATKHARQAFNFLGRFMLLFYFATTLFANPVGYINFVDPTFIYFVLFLGVMDNITYGAQAQFRKRQLAARIALLNSQHAA